MCHENWQRDLTRAYATSEMHVRHCCDCGVVSFAGSITTWAKQRLCIINRFFRHTRALDVSHVDSRSAHAMQKHATPRGTRNHGVDF